MVGVDADVGGDFQAFARHGQGVQLGVVVERARGGQRIHAAGANRGNIVFGFNHIAVAGENQGVALVGDDEHGFQTAQSAVGTPFFGQFNRRAQQLAVLRFQFGFKALEEGEGVGGGAGKARQYLVVVEAADFARVAFHDGLAEGYLSVAGNGDMATTAHGEDGGGMSVKHDCPLR